jgi:hypothetical protein
MNRLTETPWKVIFLAIAFLLLAFFFVVWPGLAQCPSGVEDYTTFIVQTGGATLSIEECILGADNISRPAGPRLKIYKEYSQGAFSSFTHTFRFKVTEVNDVADAVSVTLWSVSTNPTVGNPSDATWGASFSFSFWEDGFGVDKFTLRGFSTSSASNVGVLSINSYYYVTIIRESDGDIVSSVYHDSGRTHLFNTRTVTIDPGISFNHIMAIGTYGSADSDEANGIIVENLYLGLPTPSPSTTPTLTVTPTPTPTPTTTPTPLPEMWYVASFMPSTDSVTIGWHSDRSTVGKVELSTDGSDWYYDTTGADSGVQHQFTIPGLEENTRYYYKVYGDDVELGDGWTRTAKDSSYTAFTFVIVGDEQSHSSSEAINVLMEGVPDVDFYVPMGDLVSNNPIYFTSYTDAWVYFLDQPFKRQLPLYPIVGNHDEARGGWDEFIYPPMDSSYYSFDYGNTTFAIANSGYPYSLARDSVQWNWLSSVLNSSDKTHKILALHNPVLDSYDRQTDLLDLVRDAGVILAAGGHHHFVEHLRKDGVNYMTISSAGAPTILQAPPVPESLYQYNNIGSKRVYSVVGVEGSRMRVSVYNQDDDLIYTTRFETPTPSPTVTPTPTITPTPSPTITPKPTSNGRGGIIRRRRR